MATDLVIAVVAIAGPALFVVLLLDERLGLRERLEEWRFDRECMAWEREWERNRLRPLVRDGGWAVPDASTRRLVGERWWRQGRRGDRNLLVVQEEGLFDRYWCTYEMHELAPFLTSALPVSECRTANDLFGGDVRPSSSWVPRRGAVHYPWKPVPAYVDRSLAATAAWVDRQRPGLLGL